MKKTDSSIIVGLFIILPLACMGIIETFELEPYHTYFRNAFTTNQETNTLGFFVQFVAMLTPPIALGVVSWPLYKIAKAGKKKFPFLNVIFSFALLTVIVLFIIAIIIDQYPCWMGVPNCD